MTPQLSEPLLGETNTAKQHGAVLDLQPQTSLSLGTQTLERVTAP